MTEEQTPLPGYWETVSILLGAARKRAAGRRKRQRELMQQRRGDSGAGFDIGCLAGVMTVVLALVLNGFAAWAMVQGLEEGGRVDLERAGKIAVSPYFYRGLKAAAAEDGANTREKEIRFVWMNAETPASNIARERGGNEAEIEKQINRAVKERGIAAFAIEPYSDAALGGQAEGGQFAAMLGSLLLGWWLLMLVCQGEGLELDLQRRRHPMWEWIFSHPVREGPVFFAEMLSPLAANPLYWGAPLMPAILFGYVYGQAHGLLAAVVIGLPVMLAAACLGKALEIGIILRFAPRSRGAMIGIMSWLGYASTVLAFPLALGMPRVASVLNLIAGPFLKLPWPWIRIFLGIWPSGEKSFAGAVLADWVGVVVVVAGAVAFSLWGAQRGLSGAFGSEDLGPGNGDGRVRFGKEPLYRKELLWFMRDRSAIVQTILIPLTVAGYQLFNLRGLLAMAQNEWNYLSGTAILFGTYFLWVLGPKSLSSEGSALWIALTWPRGLESLLKAKAWLWAMISTAIVALVMIYAAISFPSNAWKVGLVGIGWFFFARSMAEKTVTLVTVTSSSGEAAPLPRGRRMAAGLGMLTFSIGVFTQQWDVAIMGIVYSYLTAAAMWESFRARLPYLYDPWSERLPPAPTLLHAMVAISLLVEGGTVISSLFLFVTGPEELPVVRAVVYCVCAVVVSYFLSVFLKRRGVTWVKVWEWHRDLEIPGPMLKAVGLGVVMGGALGFFAHGYLWAIHHFAFAAQAIDEEAKEQMANPNLRLAYGVAAVGFAPFAEEYLFRGLLYRALDKEWGGWKAVVGSAAFFAIYHPPLSWVPVGMLGLMNARLFKKTGYLWAAVMAHMAYNAVVVW